MNHLATIFPVAERLRLPVSRDQAVLLFVAVDEIMLGLETFLAHSISRTIRPNEWIPIVAGPIIGVLVLISLLSYRRQRGLSAMLILLTMSASIVIGLLGTYFHLVRAIHLSAPPGQQVTLARLIWAPPVIAPPVFVLIGVLGLLAFMAERPAGSGALWLWDASCLRLPFSKLRMYFFLVSLGILIAAVTSVMDHAHTNFASRWLWIPTVTGIFGTVVTFVLGIIEKPSRADLITYLGIVLVLLVVGPIGVLLHIQADLNEQNIVVIEQFIRRAPLLAPMVFSNMGLLGLIVLLFGESVTDTR